MKVLIVDDEPIARQILRDLVESTNGLEYLGEAANGNEAVERIIEADPDLVLLDLEMPGQGGISVIRSLRGTRLPLVIFVTAYEQHALEAFEVGAVDYLLKPVRRERFAKAIEKVRRHVNPARSSVAASVPKNREMTRKIVGRKGSDMYLLEPGDIVAFQAEGELVHIVTGSQRYLSDQPLKILAERLEHLRFRRIHRGTIVNTDHIRKISPLTSKRWLLTMSNGFEAIVSKRLASSIRDTGRW